MVLGIEGRQAPARSCPDHNGRVSRADNDSRLVERITSVTNTRESRGAHVGEDQWPGVASDGSRTGP
jgi:hypothetical protein